MTERFDRTIGRRAAVQVLYGSELLNTTADVVLESGTVPAETELNDYGRGLLLGVAAHAVEIDRLISERSQNWAIDRMPVVDRQLLRTTVYEMLYVDEVPVPVSINEAVEIAKDFGGDDSHRFINGVLGRIARDIEQGLIGKGSAAVSAEEEASQPAEEAEVESDVEETVESTEAEPAATDEAVEQAE